MSMHRTTQESIASSRPLPVWWGTIAAFAIVICYADGFWVTSLQGAVGAIERSGPPTQRWLHDSTLMLPLYFIAVVAALLTARRLVGEGHRALVKFATAALLITLFTTGVTVAEMAASSAYDYHLQSQHLLLEHHLGHQHSVAAGAAQQATFNVHVRAVRYASGVQLITNFVLVLWVLALRSNRLWRRSDSTPMSAAPAVSENWSVA